MDQIPGLSRGGVHHRDMNTFKQRSFCVRSFLSVQSCQVFLVSTNRPTGAAAEYGNTVCFVKCVLVR